MKTKTITLNNKKLAVKMAYSASEQARGLMNITNLPEDEGMLFCYPDEKPRTFWMKSTEIPLSIAFFNKNKEITEITHLKPYDESGITSNNPAKWALEVNKGWFDKNNVKIGDKFDMIDNRDIKIRVLKSSTLSKANKLAKAIEDKLVDMTMKALKTKIGVDKLGDLNIDVEVK